MNIKDRLIALFHRILGYERYLVWFSILKIWTLGWDRRKWAYRAFVRNLPPSGTVIVAGGCTGITTVPFARRHPQRRLVAFEPEPHNFRALSRVVQYFKLPDAELVAEALGDATGIAELVLPVWHGAPKHGLPHIAQHFLPGDEQGRNIQVPIGRLDDHFEGYAGRIIAIQLVAENHEAYILKGAKALIMRHKPLIYCELWYNVQRAATLATIRDMGYTVLFRKGRELLPFDGSNYWGRYFVFRHPEGVA